MGSSKKTRKKHKGGGVSALRTLGRGATALRLGRGSTLRRFGHPASALQTLGHHASALRTLGPGASGLRSFASVPHSALGIPHSIKIDENVIKEYHDTVQDAKETSSRNKFAQYFLDVMSSKSNNELLEKFMIKAVGAICRARGARGQGANSACGLWEAKPMKTPYYHAHISCDTAKSLKRHQTIPFIVLGGATEDGGEILWVLVTSYRVFDNSRFTALVSKLKEKNPDTGDKFTNLPDDLEERWNVLSNLEKAVDKKQCGINCNKLPITDLKRLSPGMYEVWLNPKFEAANYTAKDKAIIYQLHKHQEPMTREFVQEAMNVSSYFTEKLKDTPELK
jgi:hypothetical protein